MAHSVLWRGTETPLEGPELKVGQKAPTEFTIVAANDLSPIKGADLAGKPRILLTSASVDTGVCDTEVRKFNEEAAKIPGVEVVYVSLDLPFALKRWCGAAGVERVKAASDWKDRSFGKAYGAFAPSKTLHARAVFVVGKDDVIKHVEYVKEATTEPNYGAALEAAKTIT